MNRLLLMQRCLLFKALRVHSRKFLLMTRAWLFQGLLLLKRAL